MSTFICVHASLIAVMRIFVFRVRYIHILLCIYDVINITNIEIVLKILYWTFWNNQIYFYLYSYIYIYLLVFNNSVRMYKKICQRDVANDIFFCIWLNVVCVCVHVYACVVLKDFCKYLKSRWLRAYYITLVVNEIVDWKRSSI